MKASFLLALLVLSPLNRASAAPFPQGPTCYAHDLGASDRSMGVGGGGDLIILNGYQAPPGTDAIVELSATFGSPADPSGYAGGNIVWAIWEDPNDDFDPHNAVLLWSAPDIVDPATIDTDLFQSISVPSVTVSDVFFVGVMFDDHLAGEAPASLEQTVPSSGRAWIAADTTGSGDIGNLLANDFGPVEMSAIGFDGVWMVRAVGPNCSGGTTIGTAYCPGDGSGTPCPCGNDNDGSIAGGLSGCANGSSAGGARLYASGTTSVANADLVLHGGGIPSHQPGLFFQGLSATGGGAGNPFGDGLRCAGSGIVRLEVLFATGAGTARTTTPIAATGGVLPGDVRDYQLWYRDPVGTPCGSTFNLTNGVEISWTP